MHPGYGFSPLPDFQPHLHAFHCRREGPDMWIPGSGEPQALSEPREGRPLIRQRHQHQHHQQQHHHHHQHIAVCQQETLAFIDLPPADTNGYLASLDAPSRLVACPRPPNRDSKGSAAAGLCRKSSSSSSSGDAATDTEPNHEGSDSGLDVRNSHAETLHADKSDAESPVLGILRAPKTLFLPLNPYPGAGDVFDPQQPGSPSSPAGSEGQDQWRPHRRLSPSSVKEKSIRRKMRVYSRDSLSDESLSSPGLECDYLFPGSFESFLEEELGTVGSTLSRPLSGLSSTDVSSGAPTPPPLSLAASSSHLPEVDTVQREASMESVLTPGSGGGGGGSLLFHPRTQTSVVADPERRRFSASELISRLQLSQRKNSFTLKLGKSLSARVASRDRQPAGYLSADYRPSSKQRSSGGSTDSAPHSPVGSTPTLPSADWNPPLQRRSGKHSMRKDSIEEDGDPHANMRSTHRLSRFMPSSILYQEYSDVAINREIQRQQGAEPGTEEYRMGDTPSPSNLSPSSSFRSSRGSAFSLWQDIPDVRTSDQLDNFSNEERKLQEAKFELVTSEASYIRSLTIVVDHFMMSQELAECLGVQDRQWLFSKLPEVKDVSERFLHDLEQRLEGDILRFDVCDIVLDHCPALRKVYLPYVTNQAYQEQTYQRLLQENPRFPGILARLEEDPICQRLPLTSFLILPFQRITRLKMLVENILKRTTPGSRDEDTATKAFNELKKLIKECNSSVQSMKRMEELIHLNKKIHFEGKIFPLISQSRWLVKHGELLEVDTQTMSISGSKFKLPTRPVYLHLFNDCLLLSRKKDTWKFMVFVHAKIAELRVKDLSQKLQGITGFLFYLQLYDGQQLKHQILLKSHTESNKQRWISAMVPSEAKTSLEQAIENDDISQVQCIKSYQAQEHDELTLEKADILQAKTITSDGWVEGIRLSDGERGWFPKSYVEEITNRSARLRNLRENIRIKCVTQKLEEEIL
ncbi:rho guanine nucleotide exchange factor 19 [Alosa sapidissima]|uniref:rho guanine nucleotide exchange factor 19 n=1 Tax=Alosa sapidissima TaxID=34773 RepID=UPI001C0803B2|nr:rho guanine nucleotide exchange factor 19 [Alosa sapidissima]